MDKEKMMMKMKWMKKNVQMDLLLSMSFSLFGMLLIFGLGFVFPSINPYVVIKWIIIVAAVVFAYSFVTFVVMKVMHLRLKMTMKGDWKKEVKEVKAKRSSKK
jgi:hypothetical protein